MALHVRVGHRAVVTRQPLTFSTPACDDVPAEPALLGQFSWPRGQKLLRRYGDVAVRRLEQWSDCLHTPNEPILWVSTVQLFLGYTMRFGPPQVFRDGAWVDLSTADNGRLVQVPTALRIRWFSRQMREFAAHARSSWRSRECRPHSVALQVKLTCFPVQWPSDLHHNVETFLARNLPGGAVSGNSRAWRQLPLP